MTTIGLIDYGMGNLHSVQRAFERLECEVALVHSAKEMPECDALVLPGVGAFDPAMERLHASGLVAAICLGLQLLFEGSDEGEQAGLGLLKGRVQALPRQSGHSVPHMGWEPLIASTPSPLLPSEGEKAWMYFVHSFAAVPTDPICTTAMVQFGSARITAAVWQEPIGACQFHPEKSSLSGEAMLRRWLQWVEQRS